MFMLSTGVWHVPPDQQASEEARARREATGGYLAHHRWMDRVLDQTHDNGSFEIDGDRSQKLDGIPHVFADALARAGQEVRK